jgi:hypothetical protein
MTGPAGFRPSWWRISCISFQSPVTWCGDPEQKWDTLPFFNTREKPVLII